MERDTFYDPIEIHVCPTCGGIVKEPIKAKVPDQPDDCKEIDKRFCEAYSDAVLHAAPDQSIIEAMHDAYADLLRLYRSKSPTLEAERDGAKRWAGTMQQERDYWHSMAESLNTPTERESGEPDYGILPYDVKIGAIVFRAGVSLETLINAARRWHKMAGESFMEGIDMDAVKKALTDLPTTEIEGGK